MKKITFIVAMLLCAMTINAQDWITKALDDNGEPTFDWSKASGFVPVLVSESVSEVINADLALDMRPNDQNIHLWVWDATYVGNSDNGGINSFGQLEDHFAMTVSNVGWSGLGIIRDGATDFSFIDDSYVLHFAIKGNPAQSHAFGIGSINFALGSTTIYDNGNPVKNLGTWPNDGEWYYVDIPIKDMKRLGNELFSSNKGGASAYTDNFFWILSGGTQGNELHIDNVFLYKDKNLVANDELYILGSFNGWSVDTKEALAPMGDGKFAIVKELEANAEFKFMDQNGTWIGGVSEGNFIVTKEQVENGTELSLATDGGMNFQIPVAGIWTLVVDKANMKLVISGEWKEVLKGDCNNDGVVDVKDVTALITYNSR